MNAPGRPGGRASLARYLTPIAVIVVLLLATVFLPFVNRAALWFDLPSMMVWSVLLVLAITPALAALEFSGRYDDTDAQEKSDRLQRERAATDRAHRREPR